MIHLHFTHYFTRTNCWNRVALTHHCTSSSLQRKKLWHLRVEVDLVGLHAGFVSWSVWVPSVHLELLYSGLCCWSCCCLGVPHRLTTGTKRKETSLFWLSTIYIIHKKKLLHGYMIHSHYEWWNGNLNNYLCSFCSLVLVTMTAYH